MWHPELNEEFTPDQFKPHTSRWAWFIDQSGHVWQDTITNRSTISSRGRGGCCPDLCARRLGKTFADVHPEVAAEWHPTKNGDLLPKDFMPSDYKWIWWLCAKCGYEWNCKLASRSAGTGCVSCYRTRRYNEPILEESLEFIKPAVAALWHPTKNDGMLPTQFRPESTSEAWFQDKDGCEWSRAIRHSYWNSEDYCPSKPTINNQRSFAETFILTMIEQLSDLKVVQGYSIQNPGNRLVPDGTIASIKLCVEFDGSYWHRDKIDSDEKKSERIIAEGYRILRIRDYPLGAIDGAENITFDVSTSWTEMALVTTAYILHIDVDEVRERLAPEHVDLAYAFAYGIMYPEVTQTDLRLAT